MSICRWPERGKGGCHQCRLQQIAKVSAVRQQESEPRKVSQIQRRFAMSTGPTTRWTLRRKTTKPPTRFDGPDSLLRSQITASRKSIFPSSFRQNIFVGSLGR
ncbi:hypothetical protein PV05_05624 [Exophiala xenobiotica]|uniref:Uncharacterized protein n=1 Tax=Exophiala xenobiotica TaxID=348802 RepID=A0A0D2FAJ9_9EURO|nr:uncharacterized protein PV05_05624 [Exophiala xenobiotica]KIW57019.1 hypothetical protein PV05_05624 [Exophiala xenobiotica]